jgi:hypothetical protein
MKLLNAFSKTLLIVFFYVTTISSVVPVIAQSPSLFEGMIAYLDATGNVIILTEDGRRLQVTNDAYLILCMRS